MTAVAHFTEEDKQASIFLNEALCGVTDGSFDRVSVEMNEKFRLIVTIFKGDSWHMFDAADCELSDIEALK